MAAKSRKTSSSNKQLQPTTFLDFTVERGEFLLALADWIGAAKNFPTVSIEESEARIHRSFDRMMKATVLDCNDVLFKLHAVSLGVAHSYLKPWRLKAIERITADIKQLIADTRKFGDPGDWTAVFLQVQATVGAMQSFDAAAKTATMKISGAEFELLKTVTTARLNQEEGSHARRH